MNKSKIVDPSSGNFVEKRNRGRFGPLQIKRKRYSSLCASSILILKMYKTTSFVLCCTLSPLFPFIFVRIQLFSPCCLEILKFCAHKTNLNSSLVLRREISSQKNIHFHEYIKHRQIMIFISYIYIWVRKIANIYVPNSAGLKSD